MRYIIIEDEQIAATRLRKLVTEIRPDYEYVISIDSVEGASISLPVLKFDLVFMDIQLADGLSFDIFDEISMKKPVIFTTAYDQYAIRAFKTNGVGYLLKPLDPEELEGAIVKFESLVVATQKHDYQDDLKKVLQTITTEKGYKERFVVKIGDHIKTISVEDIDLFYSQDKTTFLLTKEGRNYIIDYPLDRLVELLSPKNYFRISRKFIVQMDGIEDILAFSNSRLKLKIKNFDDENVIVARERVQDFKQWIDR